ncbi:MAG: flippase-like domain-containing protein [Deltaproteobacteria bacterium]|nr:flippase-like domain-containing protein [Deltaproteobacteria bacterium]
MPAERKPARRPQTAEHDARAATSPRDPEVAEASGLPTSDLAGQSKRRILVATAAFALLGFGFMFFYSDGRELLNVASSISPYRLALPVALTLFSYVLMTMSYDGIARAAGAPTGFLPMLRITFVSNVVNYIVATGGLSGFALRMYFFRQSGIPVGRAVTISFVQGLITNLTLLIFLVMGFVFLLTRESLGTAALVSAATLLALFILATAVALLLLVHRRVRRRVLFWGLEASHAIGRRFLPHHRAPRRFRMWRLQINIERGFAFILANWPKMVLPVVYIVLDWVVTLGVLRGCFWCVNLYVPFPLVTVGFAIGILFSIVSLAPGGLGIMEGSMTTVFVGLGTPLEQTVVAVLIFRLAYYAVPFLVSVAFFRTMLRVARGQS